jgi:transposase
VSSSQVSECLSCRCGIGVGLLVPHLAGVAVQEVRVEDGRVMIWARTAGAGAACTGCGAWSGRVHSCYRRQLADLPAGGQPARIVLTARRFFCAAPGCGKTTFAEQVPGLTVRYGRRTPPLAAALAATGLALAGRAGSRLAAVLAMPATRWSLLRLVMALPDPDRGQVSVLGVDDFSFLRGVRYGTILADMETGRPVDVLDGRDQQVLAGWLDAHPGVTVICRDRDSEYAAAARASAPAAVQVADRWHLLHNLGGRVRDTVAAHLGCLHDPDPEPPPGPSRQDLAAAAAAALQARQDSSPQVTRMRAAWQQVQDLHAQGATTTEVMTATGLSRSTVLRYQDTATTADLLAHAPGRRPSVLDPFKDHLITAWAAGQHSILNLHQQITAAGYAGSYRRVQLFLQPLRAITPPAPKPPPAPRTSQITRLLLTPATRLTPDQQTALASARARCPHLDRLATRTTAFAALLTSRKPALLTQWITDVSADDQPDLHHYITGLNQDLAAVTNAIALHWNSGRVEGHVNRLKMLKRQMYGRAGTPLLRKRVLLT